MFIYAQERQDRIRRRDLGASISWANDDDAGDDGHHPLRYWHPEAKYIVDV